MLINSPNFWENCGKIISLQSWGKLFPLLIMLSPSLLGNRVTGSFGATLSAFEKLSVANSTLTIPD